MSSTSATKINQKEYLKKYLSGDKVKKKKKDKKHKKSSSSASGVKVKIIDDDINHLDSGPQIDEELLLTGDDAPQIVGEYIEENPGGERKQPKWRSIGIKEEPQDDGEYEGAHTNTNDLWGRKAKDLKIKQEFSAGKKRSVRTPDYSPPRRKDRKRHSASPNPPAQRGISPSSPQRKTKRDKSPRRKQQADRSPDYRYKIKQEPPSPPNPKRSPDQSPLRRRQDRRKSFDSSPPRKRRSSLEASPTRGDRRRVNDQSTSRNAKNSRDYTPPNLESVKRKPTRFSDRSPPRKGRSHSNERSPAALRRNSDQSPARKGRNHSPDQSPPRRKHSLDQSPPRKGRHQSPPPRNRSSDQSPPRKGRNRSPDQSPPRRRRSPDQSPPRKGRNHSRNQSRPQERCYSDQSPPRKGRIRSPDQSPPRRRHSPGQSPNRKGRNHSPNQFLSQERRSSDQSPPRKVRNHSPDQLPPRRGRNRLPDQSPPHKRRSPDQSPPRRGRNHSLDQSPLRRRRSLDQSPPRRDRNRSPDQSPPRRNRNSPTRQRKPVNTSRNSSPNHIKREPFSPRSSRWERQESNKSLSPPPTHKPKPGKTLDGKTAGLQDAQALYKESLERRKQEERMFEKMSSDVSGRNAEVQVRSTGRKGRRAREAAAEDPEERRRKEEHEEKKKHLYDRWGKGLKQIEDHKNRLLEQQHESSKPLARYEDDEDLERHLKEQERAEDPMLEYMRQKRKEKEKQEGKPQIPRYEGPFPENRFGIRPGYRWDGVDRSNGYEKKYFAMQNEKRARQDEAYKYSVEDM